MKFEGGGTTLGDAWTELQQYAYLTRMSDRFYCQWRILYLEPSFRDSIENATTRTYQAAALEYVS